MFYTLIGSRLFAELFPSNPKVQQRCKETADYDFLVEIEPHPTFVDEMKQQFGNKTEVHYIPVRELFTLLTRGSIEQRRNAYFTLKASHISFHKVHSRKTFYDLFLMSGEGCKIIEPLFYDLHKYWTDKFGEPWRADFTKESSDFFDDAVSRETLHDELHKSVAYYDQPAFKFLQEPNQTTVWVCPDKFKEVSEHIRQRVVIEEAQTLALERFILTRKLPHLQIAYIRMVEALVDRLAPLWMTIYIINNLHYFLTFNENYAYKK
jgi:hypothetical protein